MRQGSFKRTYVRAITALFCILCLVPQHGNTATNPRPLSRLTEELFQRAEPTVLQAPTENDSSLFSLANPEEALRDPDNRISDDFSVPKPLEKRVQFWFNIYTKYGDRQNVIHHVLYPWIVFDVVDSTPIYQNENLHKWTKYHKAQNELKAKVAKIRLALKKLSKRGNYRNLSGLEKSLYEKLAELPGKRKTVFSVAAMNVRTQLGQKDFILTGLTHATKYLPYMEEEFRSAGLPEELTRLPFVESSFNVNAESKVGASGIWQIMPTTGRAYLTVNDHVDERNSPLKASMVAIELFRSNYRALKDWPLAVTAYNHGASGIKNALKKSRSTNLIELINRVHSGSFKFASANFYTSYLAVLHAEKYHREIFSDMNFNKESPIRYSVYSLDRKMRAKKLAQITGLSHDSLVDFNLDLKDALKLNGWVPKGFKVLVPLDRRYELDTKLSTGLRPVREAKADEKSGKASSKGS